MPHTPDDKSNPSFFSKEEIEKAYNHLLDMAEKLDTMADDVDDALNKTADALRGYSKALDTPGIKPTEEELRNQLNEIFFIDFYNQNKDLLKLHRTKGVILKGDSKLV